MREEPGFVDGFFGGLLSLFCIGCILLAIIEIIIKPLIALV